MATCKKNKGRKYPLHKGDNLSAEVDIPDYFWERFLERKQHEIKEKEKVSATPT